MPGDVFITHSHEDKNLVEQIAIALEAQGIPCWFAPRTFPPAQIGLLQSWRQSITVV